MADLLNGVTLAFKGIVLKLNIKKVTIKYCTDGLKF